MSWLSRNSRAKVSHDLNQSPAAKSAILFWKESAAQNKQILEVLLFPHDHGELMPGFDFRWHRKWQIPCQDLRRLNRKLSVKLRVFSIFEIKVYRFWQHGEIGEGKP
jgi:hypothetical protein